MSDHVVSVDAGLDSDEDHRPEGTGVLHRFSTGTFSDSRSRTRDFVFFYSTRSSYLSKPQLISSSDKEQDIEVG